MNAQATSTVDGVLGGARRMIPAGARCVRLWLDLWHACVPRGVEPAGGGVMSGLVFALQCSRLALMCGIEAKEETSYACRIPGALTADISSPHTGPMAGS